MENMTSTVDFKKYKNVFCDSAEALDWAYKNGLNKNAIIRTSSPEMLWKDNLNILNLADCWSKVKIKKFLESTNSYSKDIYDSVLNLKDISHEEALCITRDLVRFDRVLFKAACLKQNDLIEPLLFISIEGKGGSFGNRLNPPWKDLLKNNSKFKIVPFKIKDDEWDVMSVKKVSIIYRLFLGGYQLIIYRFFIWFHRIFNDLNDQPINFLPTLDRAFLRIQLNAVALFFARAVQFSELFPLSPLSPGAGISPGSWDCR